MLLKFQTLISSTPQELSCPCSRGVDGERSRFSLRAFAVIALEAKEKQLKEPEHDKWALELKRQAIVHMLHENELFASELQGKCDYLL